MFAPRSLSQAINPWSWWLDASDNHLSLLTINHKSGNPKLEQKIVSEVAGYGMQIDLIEEVLSILVASVPKTAFNRQQRETIAAFEEMMERIRATKQQEADASLSPGGVEKLVDQLGTLKRDHPQQYESIRARLRDALA